jgi:RNA polymerase sigma-70 factor (ECF subfamily)
MTMTAKKSTPALPQARITNTGAAELSEAFEVVFHEHWPQIFEFLVRLVGDPAEAEDLALETFLRLYQKPPQKGGVETVGGWLYRVAANLGFNSIRGWKRRQQYERKAGQFDLFNHNEASPADILIAKEEQQIVRRILAGMSAKQALILVMRHSGMAYREIAAVLGLSATSIGPLLNRAEGEFERRFRAKYKEEEDENAPE